MNLMMFGMLVSVSLCIFIVSNILLMSKATATMRCGDWIIEVSCGLVADVVQSRVLSVHV